MDGRREGIYLIENIAIARCSMSIVLKVLKASEKARNVLSLREWKLGLVLRENADRWTTSDTPNFEDGKERPQIKRQNQRPGFRR